MTDAERSFACPTCRAALSPGARFCSACGAATKATPSAPPDVLGPTFFKTTAPGSTAAGAIPPMRLLPGTRIGVYRVEDVIGEGGMGVVYRAHDDVVGRTVAIKCLHTNLAGD